ncbi:MAG: DegT/DnrJ/EryC1/StrS family aminotransferase [Deltaproteobacteria bacterium]|nr:DegT/DnrJ/EryC1/StrS family aminotransferase [Deltaproteobacteria bacterium]MBI3293212.1 DegT/DnrJ/EryC1/StrS family aminotransferase [Deltaproteobacteria bacterium]
MTPLKDRHLIPQIQPWINEEEVRLVSQAVHSTLVTEAEFTRKFETQIAGLTGAKHAIAVCNGTAALYCALKALGIGPGDEVIVPDLTYVATANAVIMAGADPVFCEIRKDTFCIDLEWAERLITHRTKVVIPVHLYGQSADMDQVLRFARHHNLKIIEDAAQAVGVRFQGKHVGTFGELGIISFYGNKTITCGEGGVVLTEDDALATSVRRLKNHGRDKRGTFVHEHIGFNFSITEMQAALGVAQMGKLGRIIQRKREIHDRYLEELAGFGQLEPCQVDPRCSPVFWFTSCLCQESEQLAEFLLENQVQTRRFFPPLHLQPCYANHPGKKENTFPVSEELYRCGISLPSAYLLTEIEQSQVIATIKKFFR